VMHPRSMDAVLERLKAISPKALLKEDEEEAPFPGIRLHEVNEDESCPFPGIRHHQVTGNVRDSTPLPLSPQPDEKKLYGPDRRFAPAIIPSNLLSTSSGWSSVQGTRPAMEDAHAVFDREGGPWRDDPFLHDYNINKGSVIKRERFIIPPRRFPNSSLCFYGVYDGHAGKTAAELCAKYLHLKVVESQAFAHGKYLEALADAFAKTDEIILATPPPANEKEKGLSEKEKEISTVDSGEEEEEAEEAEKTNPPNVSAIHTTQSQTQNGNFDNDVNNCHINNEQEEKQEKDTQQINTINNNTNSPLSHEHTNDLSTQHSQSNNETHIDYSTFVWFPNFAKPDKLTVGEIKEKQKQPKVGGACAAVAIIVGHQLFVANVGDCEVVLAKSKPNASTHEAVVLTEKHKVVDAKERERIERLGGKVIFGRLFGDLAVSRALGDADYKRPLLDVDFVSGQPHLRRHQLCPGEDAFLILACDGLWDKVTYDEAINIVASMRYNGKTAKEISRALTEEATDARKGGDNTTVIVVLFEWQKETLRPNSKMLSRPSVSKSGTVWVRSRPPRATGTGTDAGSGSGDGGEGIVTSILASNDSQSLAPVGTASLFRTKSSLGFSELGHYHHQEEQQQDKDKPTRPQRACTLVDWDGDVFTYNDMEQLQSAGWIVDLADLPQFPSSPNSDSNTNTQPAQQDHPATSPPPTATPTATGSNNEERVSEGTTNTGGTGIKERSATTTGWQPPCSPTERTRREGSRIVLRTSSPSPASSPSRSQQNE
jgi:protein phosphatase 2C family protein 2/3